MNWTLESLLLLPVSRRDARLALLLAHVPEGWVVVAIEGPATVCERPEEQMAAVLATHSHQQLPMKPTMREAIDMAENYASWWRKSGAVHDECECGGIAGEAG